MSSRSAALRASLLFALAAAGLVPGCADPPPRAPDPPPPAEAPAVVAPAVDETARPPVLAWRVGTAERASYLVAVPPYPASVEEVLPGAWGREVSQTGRLVVLTGPEAAGAVLLRHGLGSARTDLRDVLGETPFTRLASRLGSIDGRTHRTALASMDVRGALLVLVLAELGYRAPGEGFLDQLVVRVRGEGDVITWLVGDREFARWAEGASEADVTGDLLERIEDPSRTANWADAVRAAFSSADLAALTRACEEPERTASWVVAARRANRELAATLLEPVERELSGEPTLVALDGCLLAGDAGLVAGLRARGVALAMLHETTGEVPGEVAAPLVGEVAAAPAGEVAAPRAGEVAAPPAGEVAAPRAGEVAAPPAGEVAAPPAGEVAAPPSAATGAPVAPGSAP